MSKNWFCKNLYGTFNRLYVTSNRSNAIACKIIQVTIKWINASAGGVINPRQMRKWFKYYHRNNIQNFRFKHLFFFLVEKQSEQVIY